MSFEPEQLSQGMNRNQQKRRSHLIAIWLDDYAEKVATKASSSLAVGRPYLSHCCQISSRPFLILHSYYPVRGLMPETCAVKNYSADVYVGAVLAGRLLSFRVQCLFVIHASISFLAVVGLIVPL